MVVIRTEKILAPLVVFKTPRQPFYQHLHVGTHVGTVELLIHAKLPRPPFTAPELGAVTLLEHPHEIWLSQKADPNTCDETAEMIALLKETMSDMELQELVSSKRKWALRCAGKCDPTCKCAHNREKHEDVCKCFESIIHGDHYSDFPTAIAMSSRFIFDTLETGTIARDYGGNSSLKVEFDFKGEKRSAMVMSGSRFLMFATMEEFSFECLELCRQLRDWATIVNIDHNFARFI